ncbi:MAG: hypothetical protein ABIR70_00210 [Bryobacteraceae bacterium]
MKTRIFAAAWIAAAQLSYAQDPPPADPHAGHDMSAMDHSTMNHSNMNEAESYLMKMASGTSQNPLSWPMPMLMPKLGSWNLMIMGQGFVNSTQQSGPRGGDKIFAANWAMISATHRLGGGALMLQSMFSLDPATVTKQAYPLLFQTGETANGTPLVDAQHPHDFIMGLGVQYAHSISENTMFQAYYAPVGDPALGPVSFPHRASAFELPQATLSHHVQDSTHIAINVATVAIRHKWLRLEASSFYGTEPNENRWNIDWGPMNSYSGRVSILPSSNWMAQFSAGRLKDPERQSHSPGDEAHGGDIVRMTSSVHYTRPMGNGNHWSTSVIWGGNHNVQNQRNTNSYLVETLYPVSPKNFLTARAEVVDKDELFTNNHTLEHQLELIAGNVFRVKAYTGGYTRDIGTFQNVETGIGANLTAYVIPAAIQPYYGQHPWGVNMFVRFRIKPKS